MSYSHCRRCSNLTGCQGPISSHNTGAVWRAEVSLSLQSSLHPHHLPLDPKDTNYWHTNRNPQKLVSIGGEKIKVPMPGETTSTPADITKTPPDNPALINHMDTRRFAQCQSWCLIRFHQEGSWKIHMVRSLPASVITFSLWHHRDLLPASVQYWRYQKCRGWLQSSSLRISAEVCTARVPQLECDTPHSWENTPQTQQSPQELLLCYPEWPSPGNQQQNTFSTTWTRGMVLNGTRAEIHRALAPNFALQTLLFLAPPGLPNHLSSELWSVPWIPALLQGRAQLGACWMNNSQGWCSMGLRDISTNTALPRLVKDGHTTSWKIYFWEGFEFKYHSNSL